ncbi:MAG TPA: hypothetical protein VN723_14285 [Rhizomicrobium sp.]|jgi:hypothetical protein|nr:hypothetical protein [Rhizomicrobium sp.]
MSPRRFLALVFLAGLTATPASADTDPTRNDVMANIERCSAITDNRVWLNCFYGAAQPMRAQLGLPPAPDSQVALVKNAPVPTAPMKKDSGGWLGLGNLNPFSGSSDEDEFSRGTTRLASYTFGKDGLFTATLADGEVWKQSPYDDLRAHWNGQATGYVVIVTSDVMGSHTMKVKGDQDYRVMRVK